jgi:hypothetical protein
VKTVLATLAAALFVVGLYAVVGFQSPGYDDEYANIGLVESPSGYAGIVALADSTDVHPPGQYLIDKLLFDLLGDWSRVRAAGAAIAAATIVGVWLATGARGASQRAFAWLVICLNPTLLLWCTGLRWYCPFVVLLNLVLLILMRPPRRPLAYWGPLLAGLLALFYVGYLALVIAPMVLAVALHQRRATLSRERRVLGGALLVAAVLALPQLDIFFSVHLKNAGRQTVDMLTGLEVMALHLVSGQGAMPISLAGIALAAANIAALAVAVRHWRPIVRQPTALLFGGSVLAILASRVGGKLHTLVTLSTLQGILQTAIYGQASGAAARGLLFVLFAVGNIGGVVNVASHSNTTKGGWNTPYPLVLEAFRARTASCAATSVVTHDPVLAFYLRRLGDRVIFPGEQGWQERMRTRETDCLVAFETFRGSLPRERWLDYAAAVKALPGRVSVDKFGHDAFATFKRRFDPDIPDDYVTMTLFRK